MAVIAFMSASVAARTVTFAIDTSFGTGQIPRTDLKQNTSLGGRDLIARAQSKGPRAGGALAYDPSALRLFAAHDPEEVQDVDEQRDEAAVEHERAEDRGAANEGLVAGAVDVHVFDLLRLPGGHCREQQNHQRRDDEAHR